VVKNGAEALLFELTGGMEGGGGGREGGQKLAEGSSAQYDITGQ